MALKQPKRDQVAFLPNCIDDYVSESDPVRAYDAFVDSLDLKELGIYIDFKKIGNSSYDPKSMLKLLVYGYSYGVFSSRKLERATQHNLSFIWLMGDLKPDHKTIANFRKNNLEALRKVLKQSAVICLKLGLIEGNCLFVDGTKIRANASINQSKRKKVWKRILKEADEHIDQLLEECNSLDKQEQGSLVKSEKIKNKEKLKNKIKKLLAKNSSLDENQKINATDQDCIVVKGRQGTHAGYNAQAVTDQKHGLIVSTDVVAEANDLNQFTNQISQAEETLGKKTQNACGDAGYANTNDLQKISVTGVKVIVPSQRQLVKNLKDQPFTKDKFVFEKDGNCYICPEGQRLPYSHHDRDRGRFIYRMKKAEVCLTCCNFGVCTKSKKGRGIRRLENERIKEELEAVYKSEEGQKIYKLRQTKAELPFGHIKSNLGRNSFLLRGLKAVKGEMALFASCFNIARLITLLGGVPVMVKIFNGLQV